MPPTEGKSRWQMNAGFVGAMRWQVLVGRRQLWSRGAAQSHQLCRGPTGRTEGHEGRQGKDQGPSELQEKVWKVSWSFRAPLLHNIKHHSFAFLHQACLAFLIQRALEDSSASWGLPLGSVSSFWWLIIESILPECTGFPSASSS